MLAIAFKNNDGFREKSRLTTRKLIIDRPGVFYYIFNLNCIPVKGFAMNKYAIFVIRAVFSAVFAVVLSRFFRPDAGPVFIMGLALFLLAASYGTAWLRKKKTEHPGENSH